MVIKSTYTRKEDRMLVKWLGEGIGWTNPTQMTTEHLLNCIKCFWYTHCHNYINPLILEANPGMDPKDFLLVFVEELRSRLSNVHN